MAQDHRNTFDAAEAKISQRGGAHRIAVASKIEDARGKNLLQTLKSRFPEIGLTNVSLAAGYVIDAKLDESEIARVQERLTNPVTETSSASSVPCPRDFSYAIVIGYLPGVTDNVAKTARQTIEDALGRKFAEDEGTYFSRYIFLEGVSQDGAEDIAGELHNPLIERAGIFTKEEVLQGIPILIPKVQLSNPTNADEIDLDISDRELEIVGKEGILNNDGLRRGPLALSLPEMKTIQTHFKTLGRKPTDVELEAIAQTWSEHCKHTIFADPLDDVQEGIYKKYIKGATESIRKEKGDKDFCVSVFKDNSGAIVFDDEYLVTHKVETHNSPSALDPFGGSVTAIVGVNRDTLGFGLGAKPIANVYGFCVGEPHDETAYFRDAEKKQPLLSNRRILEGVVQGINAGGNESGIPTPLGFVVVEPSYRAKPLVYGGTVGLIPRLRQGYGGQGPQKLYEKEAQPGDYVVMLGGRVGLDGIHGSTFSSESLSKGSPAAAVQIGDPITQKKLSDAIVREARDAGLYSSITDNGAGGLSGAVGEMAKESGGCVVALETIPLKYAGLAPWQIWISESQERMTLAVPKESWPQLKEIFDRHDVEATCIGEFTDSGRCVVKYGDKTVMDLDMSFLHDGRPRKIQTSKKVEPTPTKIKTESLEPMAVLKEILARPSVGSISFISEQYDFEVQGTSVTKPLQGRGRVNADAAVLQPLPASSRGIVLSHGLLPWYSALDTYAMAAASIDTAIRNAICAGARLEHLAILDNFCWSSSEKPERLYELKRAAEACYDTAVAYGTPFISGKDSMFNDFKGFDTGQAVELAAIPTLLISAIGVIEDVLKAMTIDFKQEGDVLYLVGQTKRELGASEYGGENVPRVDAAANKRVYESVSRAIASSRVSSAIGLGRGGLAVALSKSAIAGQWGAEIDISDLPGDAATTAEKLFSESQGRILLTASKNNASALEKELEGLSWARIGEVIGDSIRIHDADTFSATIQELSDSYRSYFKNW